MNYISDIFGISYVEAWYFYLIVSITIFVLSIQSQRQPLREIAMLEFKPQKIDLTKESTSGQKLVLDQELEQLKEKLELHISKERPFLNPELTIKKLATELGSNSSYLSKVINSGYSQNFNDYINGHRVQLIKEKINLGEHHQFTLLSLALECGFNSKATFNRAFKKCTGVSPAEYAKTQS